jgi:hypothetical protein
MSGTARHRDGWLRVLLLAAFLVLAPGSGAAWSAIGGGHGGGFSGGGHGGAFPRGRDFGGGRFGGRPVPHAHDHDHDRHVRPFFVFPYFYDPYYGYYPYYPDYPGNPYDTYCDPYSPYYAPQYCYWDGP